MERTKLIFINGAPGTGKSAVSRALQKMLPDCALLDGDDVWNLRPFRVTEKSKELAFANMSAVLKNYLASGLARNVVFCWVMHERRIAEELLRRIGHTGGFSLFTLTCEEEVLKRRILEGERSGARRKGGLALALERARQVRENAAALAIGLTADYWILNDNLVGPLNWFIGAGLFGQMFIGDDDFNFTVGARVPVGLNFFFARDMFELYLQVAPGLGANIGNGVEMDFVCPINYGLRFWF